VIDADTLTNKIKGQRFFNNDDNVVRKMKNKFSKEISKFPYQKRMELKSVGEEISQAYGMTKHFSKDLILTPKQYIFEMMNRGWDGWMLLSVSPYLSEELETAVLKYFVSPK